MPSAEKNKKESYGDRRSAIFEAWARIVIRFRWVALLVCFVISLAAFDLVATDLMLENAIEKVVAGDSEARMAANELLDDFGMDALFQVLVRGDVFTPEFLARLRDLHNDLAIVDMPTRDTDQSDVEPEPAQVASNKEDGSQVDAFSDFEDFGPAAGGDRWSGQEGGTVFEEITSLINVRDTKWVDDAMVVQGLMDQWPEPKDLPDLKRRVLSDPTMVGRVVGPNGGAAVIVLRSAVISEQAATELYDKMQSVVARYQDEGFDIQIAGMPALGVALTKAMMTDIWRMISVSCIAMIIILVLIFRHLLGVIGPTFVVVQSVLWTIGLMAWTGIPLTVVTSILPGFVLCVGIGDAIHIQSVYRDNRRRGLANREAIFSAVATNGMPVFLTTLTTCFGLLSFRFATLHTVRELGTFAAIGVLAALFLSLVFLPAVLSFNRRSLLGSRQDRGVDILDRFLIFCMRLSAPVRLKGRNPTVNLRYTLLGALALAVLAVAGATLVGISYDPLSWLPDGNETRNAFQSLDKHVGGTSSVALLLEAKQGKTLKDRNLLLGIEKLEDHVKGYRDPKDGRAIVGEPISILDVVKESSRALHNNNPDYYKIPDTQQGVVDMVTVFESSSPSQLKRLATIDMSKSVVSIPVQWMDAWEYRPLTAHISKGIDEYIGDQAGVKVTGTVYTILTIVNSLVTDLMRSFGAAFAVITILMIILFKDLKLGCIAMVPNLLPIVTVGGIMGFTGIPLDVVTLLVASVGIGIAVDDTIHFLYQFQIRYKETGDVEQAVDGAMKHAGRAMVATTVILIAGHTVFLLASMSHIRTFGSMIALVVLIALLIDLIVTPALVRRFYGHKPGRTVFTSFKKRLAATASSAFFIAPRR
ncbi:MAG: MMPL family transporter [Proteobacteria bacterium]|nr:MMPL family transporter [Pseudomonadota bacterium]